MKARKNLPVLRNAIVTKNFKENLRLLRVVSGPTRFRILMLLRNSPGLTVTDLARILNVSLSRVSHQMRILRRHGLVDGVRNSRTVSYAISRSDLKKYLVY